MLEDLVKESISRISEELKKEENITKIKKEILNPLTNYIIEQIYPYLIISVIIFILTFLMATLTVILILRKSV